MVLYRFPRREMLPFMPPDPRSILDVGCSSGAFAAQLRERYPSCYLVGIEPNPEAAALASEVLDKVVCGSFPEVATELADREGYDVVVFNDVLEHMVEPSQALTSARAMLSPSGLLVASIPNVRHVSALGPLLVSGEWEYKESGVLDRTHLRFFTKRSIRRLFEHNGWTVVTMDGINRRFRSDDEGCRWWIRAAGTLTGRRSDDFFFVQYAVVARPH